MADWTRQIETVLADPDPAKRARVADNLLSLFESRARRLKKDEAELVDGLIRRLADTLEFQARVAMAEQIADWSRAPRGTLLDLASDPQIAVAGPLLSRSPCLRDDDLVTIVLSGIGTAHLVAIAGRARVSEILADALVTADVAAVATPLLGNHGARFSDRAFARLLDHVARDRDVLVSLAARDNLTRDQEALVRAAARAIVEERFTALTGRDLDGAAAEAIDALARRLDIAGAAAFDGDLDLAIARIRSGEVDCEEETIRRDFSRGAVASGVAGIAERGRLDAGFVARLFHAPDVDLPLLLARGLDLSFETLKAMLTVKAGRTLSMALVISLRERFDTLDPREARGLLEALALRTRLPQ